MFSSLKNLESAFKHIRTFSIIFLLACLVMTCFSIYKGIDMVNQVQSKIYVLAGGKAIEAFAANSKDNVEVEIRDHVKTFHQLFFSLDPDEKVIKDHINQALYLADETAKKTYDDLEESGYYNGIISGNISQKIVVDSVKINMGNPPYSFICFATQSIIRKTSQSTRNLITEGEIRDVARSDHNPHGFLIERWKILENKDLKTEMR